MKNLKLNIISVLLSLSLTAVAQNEKEDFYFYVHPKLDRPYKIYLEVDSANTTTWKLIEEKDDIEEGFISLARTSKSSYKDGKVLYHTIREAVSHPPYEHMEFIFNPLKHKKEKVSVEIIKKNEIHTLHSLYFRDKKYRLCKKHIQKTKGKFKSMDTVNYIARMYYYKYNDCFNVYMIEEINENEYWKYEVDWYAN